MFEYVTRTKKMKPAGGRSGAASSDQLISDWQSRSQILTVYVRLPVGLAGFIHINPVTFFVRYADQANEHRRLIKTIQSRTRHTIARISSAYLGRYRYDRVAANCHVWM